MFEIMNVAKGIVVAEYRKMSDATARQAELKRTMPTAEFVIIAL